MKLSPSFPTLTHRQKNWPEWLTLAEFAINNKVYSITKIFPFIVNYRRELRIEIDIRKKGKIEKIMEFVKTIKKV